MSKAMKFENVDFYHIISLNLSYYRKSIGYTQAVLAEKANISVTYLSLLESANTAKSCSLETLFDLARALQIPPYKLLKPLDDKELSDE